VEEGNNNGDHHYKNHDIKGLDFHSMHRRAALRAFSARVAASQQRL
jgi:hypothetical protein